MHARPARVLLSFALALSVAACGGGSAAMTGGGPVTTGPVATGVKPGATLIGTLGTKDNPDAYLIGITDSSGARIQTLPAGSYTLVVDDRSRIHNWVLSGPGIRNVRTEVAATGRKTFQVTLVPSTYGYACDPHPSMNGSFTAV